MTQQNIFFLTLNAQTYDTPVSLDVVLKGDGSTHSDHVILGLL